MQAKTKVRLYLMCLLYEYKSTNTDAEDAKMTHGFKGVLRALLNLLALVQEYKY